MKNPFSRLFKRKTISPIATLSAEKLGDKWFYSLLGVGVNHVIRDTDTADGQRSAYAYCPIVTSVIAKKVSAALNGRMYFIDKNGKEVQGATVKKLEALLQSSGGWNQLYALAKTMNQVFGKAMIHRRTAVGYSDVTSLRVLENWRCVEQPNGDYQYTPLGSTVMELIKRDDILFWDDHYLDFSNVAISPSASVRGGSRLVSLRDPVSNIAAAYEGENMIWTNGGAVGIASQQVAPMGNVPLTNEQRKELASAYSSHYGQQRGKNPVMVTPQPMTWTSTILPVRELMYIEGIQDNASRICDAYNISPMLLGFAAGTTFANKEQAEKALYQDAIIPEAKTFCDAINNDPVIGLSKQGYFITIDYSHVEPLQQGEGEKAAVDLQIIDIAQKMKDLGIYSDKQIKEYIETNCNLTLPS